MPNSMYAGVVHGPNNIIYEQIPVPQIADDQVLVKVAYTGICGSDVPRVNANASHFYPNVLGHEFSGTVHKAGAKAIDFGLAEGDRVSGIPLVPCMNCVDCKNGDYSLCKNYKFIGSSIFGSFAEYVAMPTANVVKFSDDVSFEQGAFFEPATVALHGLWRTDYQPGGKVAILGGGTVGMFVMQWAKIFGADQVVVFDINDNRLELAKKLGATETVNSGQDSFLDKVLEITNDRGFDYVFETAGNVTTIKMALELVCNKGKICYIGTPTREFTFSVPLWENINRKECVLTGSWMSYSNPFPGKEWEYTAKYFGNGQLKFDDSFICKKLPLSKIADAFEMFKTPGSVSGKILIDSRQ